MSAESLAIALSAISAFFAAVAATANWLQARKASQGNEVEVYLEMSKKWNSEEIRRSVSDLASFYKETGGDVAASYKQLQSEKQYKSGQIVQSDEIVDFIFCRRYQIVRG
jgi:hypothetical protein